MQLTLLEHSGFKIEATLCRIKTVLLLNSITHFTSCSRVSSAPPSFSRPARTPRAFFSKLRCPGWLNPDLTNAHMHRHIPRTKLKRGHRQFQRHTTSLRVKRFNSPAEGGVQDLQEQLVAWWHQLVLMSICGRSVHHAVVLGQQCLGEKKS